jgi:acyl dehydratase
VVNVELIGTKLYEFEFPIERGKIKEFANAILDPNPIYRDQEYAIRQGFDDVIIPVTYPVSFVHHLDAENFVLEFSLRLGLDPKKSVHGETEIIFNRPVCAGESFRGEVIVANMYESEGKRGGKMSFVEIEARFYDKENALVFRTKNIFIERS